MYGVEFSEEYEHLGEGRKAFRTDKQYTIYLKTNPSISLLAEIAWFHANRSTFQNFSYKAGRGGINLSYPTFPPRLFTARILSSLTFGMENVIRYHVVVLKLKLICFRENQ
jgi:hypothetical protein